MKYITYEDSKWMEEAKCRKVEPDVLFPHMKDTVAVRRARKICSGCPVQFECLTYALKLRPKPRFGVWATFTAEELDLVRRRRTSIMSPIQKRDIKTDDRYFEED